MEMAYQIAIPLARWKDTRNHHQAALQSNQIDLIFDQQGYYSLSADAYSLRAGWDGSLLEMKHAQQSGSWIQNTCHLRRAKILGECRTRRQSASQSTRMN